MLWCFVCARKRCNMNVLVSSEQRQLVGPDGYDSRPEAYSFEPNLTTKPYRTAEFKWCCLPNSWYNVTNGWNTRIQFSYNTVSYSADYDPGFYDGTLLASTLADAMNTAASAGGDIEVRYNTMNGKIEFQTTTSDLIVYSGTQKFGGLGLPDPHPGTGLMLGAPVTRNDIIVESAFAPAGSGWFSFPGVLDLAYPRNLLLDIQAGSANSTEGVLTWYDRHSYIIPITCNPMEFTQHFINATFNMCERSDGRSVRKFHIKWESDLILSFVDGAETKQVRYPLTFNGVNHAFLLRLT